MKQILLSFISLFLLSMLYGQQIKVNQIGFYRSAQKIAIVPEADATTFEIIDASTQEPVYSGELSAAQSWSNSGESNIRQADFTSFTKAGSYFVKSGEKKSHTFVIEESKVFDELSTWSIKAFFLWRASTAIASEHASFEGRDYSRNFGHPDNEVLIHSSAASESRPEGTVISSPKGWYDAGDYNKYVVNANPAVFSMLQVYEMYPEYYNELNLNIPESDNDIPDILDEVKWELDWLLSMQDPADGGVYTKLTTKNFSGMVLPEKATATRYVVKKSTAAALDFASMLAKAYRTFKKFEDALPGYADQCLEASKKAYAWAKANPSVYFSNPSDIKTGQYGDSNVSDEFFQAQIELYLSTDEQQYIDAASSYSNFGVPSWPSVATFGLIALINEMDNTSIDENNKIKFTRAFYKLADDLKTAAQNSPYKIPINNFFWGSNGYAAGMGMILMAAHKHSGEEAYLNAGISTLDYLLGRNGTPYCFVTGFGNKSPMHIHCRRSEADDINEPLPGYIAGGPNPGNQNSDCGAAAYPSTYGAKSYLDQSCSYSTNEIAINWNGPLVFLTGAIEASLSKNTIKPAEIATDTSGLIVTIKYNQELADFAADKLNISVSANSTAIEIDSVFMKNENTNEIKIQLKEAISAATSKLRLNMDESTIVTVMGKNLGLIEEAAIINNVTGSAPVLVDAYTDQDGKNIILSFNKALKATDTLRSFFSAQSNGTDIFNYAVPNEQEPTQYLLAISQVYKFDILTVSYDGDIISATDEGLLGSFSKITVKNNAPESPSKLVSASTLEDGYTFVLNFDKNISKGDAEKTVKIELTNGTDTQTPEISNISIDGKIAYVSISTRFTNGSLIKVSSLENGILTSGGDPILPFANVEVTNSLPAPANILAIDSLSVARLEAESYIYNSGFEVEDCSDEGETKNLGYTDSGDWTEYTVDVKHAGTYTLSARVASETSASKFTLQNMQEGTASDLVAVATPRTGGWQTWQTAQALVDLSEGMQTFRLYANKGLFNINWIEFEYGENLPTGIEEVSNDDFKIYPIPCDGSFMFENLSEQELFIQISDSKGSKVKEFTAKHGLQDVKLPLKGLYHINVNGKRVATQIVK